MFCHKKSPQMKAAVQTPDQLRAVSENLKASASATSKQAAALAHQAQDLAAQGMEWAGPKAEEAIAKARPAFDDAVKKATEYAGQAQEWAGPRVEDAVKSAEHLADQASALTKQGLEWVTPHVEEALDKAHEAKDKVVTDYAPRAKAAALAVSEAAHSEGDVKSKAAAAQESAVKALTTEPAKKGRAKKCLGIFAALSAIAGGVFYFWKRSQPVEDPWAEAYWEDIKDTVASPAAAPSPDVAATPEVATEEVAEEVLAEETPAEDEPAEEEPAKE